MNEEHARSLTSERHPVGATVGGAFCEQIRGEQELRAALQREREARVTAEANDAFKDAFLAILSHDLRNPLNTVLTTARLMTMRGDLPEEATKRLERIVSSGGRLQRMIEQLGDLSQARIAGGVPVRRDAERDLALLATEVVQETRSNHPGRVIELETSGACLALVDAARFEQLMASLLSNALVYGAADHPIRVEVAATGTLVRVVVHNHGSPIDAERLPRLFEPFRSAKNAKHPRGLGLGLYIAERIVAAHGGELSVASTEETGTTFVATFPRCE